jgi:hypothetical protein
LPPLLFLFLSTPLLLLLLLPLLLLPLSILLLPLLLRNFTCYSHLAGRNGISPTTPLLLLLLLT